MSATTLAPAPNAAHPARLRTETRYDRVIAMLLAVVLGAALTLAWLLIVYATSEAYARRVASPLEIIEVSGGGGGSPDGEEGQTETIDVPGAAAGDRASNNEVDAAAFEAPSLMATPGAMLDATLDAAGGAAEVDLAAAMPRGGPTAGGARASRLGTGRPGYGFGPGDGGVRREERWSIVFTPGQTVDEYARQLDALRVELATIQGPDSLIYAANFAGARPTTRIGPAQADRRLYFAWRGQGRKASDVELLRRAGIDVGDKPILQFYPPEVETALAQLEVSYRGRQPGEIRVTRFRVVPGAGGAFRFEVIDQQTLR
jgi:hypothetical protein